jgi:3-oxoadipate enol-lactonase
MPSGKKMQQGQNIQVNGIRLYYQDAGQGEIPLIFIHPFPFSHRAWEPQVEALKEKTRCITYDLRGFGRSELGVKKTSIGLYAEDLVQLMDKLEIAQALVCGLSMGGYILLNAAERYPQRFKAIVLADTQCLADSKENQEKRYATIKDIEDKGLEAFADKFMKKVFGPETYENNTALVEKTKQLILENSPEGIAAALDAMAQRQESCSDLKKINMPTLVLCGKEDTLTPPSLSEFLFNNIHGATLHEIEKAGHLSNLEQPDLFNQHLMKFISAVE